MHEILAAYTAKGDGDRDMLFALLNAKTAEDNVSRVWLPPSVHELTGPVPKAYGSRPKPSSHPSRGLQIQRDPLPVCLRRPPPAPPPRPRLSAVSPAVPTDVALPAVTRDPHPLPSTPPHLVFLLPLLAGGHPFATPAQTPPVALAEPARLPRIPLSCLVRAPHVDAL